MRKVKYQVWNEKSKKMYTSDDICRIHFDGGLPYAVLMWTGDMLIHKEVILRQYTGLKDKNGKEIYEGDIVECTFYENKSEISKIEWHEPSAGFIIAGYPMNIHGLHGLKILGNIYENPEKLT